MTFETMEVARTDAQWAILRRFGEHFDKAEKGLVDRFSDPAVRRLAAARVALEYAVMQTAAEKQVSTVAVAQALQGASPQQQAMMVNEGRAAMGRIYGIEPDILVGAFAGKIVDVQMPRGFATTPEFDKMIDSARNSVTAIIQESYSSRGRFEHPGNSSFVTLTSDAATANIKGELATRLAFMESAIDASMANGGLTQEGAAMLKERIEAQVFQPRPPQSTSFSKAFKTFFETQGMRMRGEVMKEVRAVTQSRTVREIGEKLTPAPKAPEPVKNIQSLER